MAMEAREIARRIKEGIPDALVTIGDLRGDGDHDAAQGGAAAVIGRNRVQHYQMAYEALRGGMADKLHALALQASVTSAG
jgi:stress-induced morphogen